VPRMHSTCLSYLPHRPLDLGCRPWLIMGVPSTSQRVYSEVTSLSPSTEKIIDELAAVA